MHMTDANFFSAVDGSASQAVSSVVNVGPASSALADVAVSAPAAGVYLTGEVITVSSSLSRVSAPVGAVAGASIDFLLTDVNGNVLLASGTLLSTSPLSLSLLLFDRVSIRFAAVMLCV